MTKYLDLIGWDDVPHLKEPNITRAELDELQAGMLPHQAQARRTGRPSLGAGAVYPVSEDVFVCDPFPIPDYWWRAYALDVGWNRTACLFSAYDPDAEIYYLTAEYYVGELEPIKHAHAIKGMMKWDYPGCIDPAAKGTSVRDGRKLMPEYEALGLDLIFARNPVTAGIHRTLTRLQTGQLRVFNTLVCWLKEFRLYRRNEKGKIIKENDHLMDDTRYLMYTDGLYMSQPIKRAQSLSRGDW